MLLLDGRDVRVDEAGTEGVADEVALTVVMELNSTLRSLADVRALAPLLS